MIAFANNPKDRASVITFGIKEIGPYYWIGSYKNGLNYCAGQTFRAPAFGNLKSIKLFSSVVFGSPNATLSIFNFDADKFIWKQKLAETTKPISTQQQNQWIRFDLEDVKVNKNENYAFKVSSNGEGMLAIAECPWNLLSPYSDGIEWEGNSRLPAGNFHKDFALAFEGEIEELLNSQFI